MNRIKKISAVLIATAIMLTTSGCYNPDNSWAMKDGDTTMSIGTYIYYLYLAYDYAAQEVPDDTEVLGATVDGQPAETWIREKAMDFARSCLWVNRKVQEFDLALTKEEADNAKANTEAQWQYIGNTLDKMGVSKDSFNTAYATYNIQYRKVFDHYYGEGGEQALTKQEITDHFIQNNFSYSYMHAPLTTADDQGELTELDESQRAELNQKFEAYKAKIGTGYYTVDTAAQDYALAASLDEPPYESAVNDLKYQYFPTDFLRNLTEMNKGEIRIFESDGQLVLLQKGDIDAAAEDVYNNPAERFNAALAMKTEEFTAQVTELAASEMTNLTLNEAAMKSIKLSDFVNTTNAMGTQKSQEPTEE